MDSPARRLGLWSPVVVYMAAIFAVSSMALPAGTAGLVPDKLAHALVYAGLALLIVRALAGGLQHAVRAGIAATAVVIAVVYGVTDEFHQSFVPARQADLADLIADAVGAAVAAGVCYLRTPGSRRSAAAGQTARRRGV